MHLSLHFPVVTAVLLIGTMINAFNVVRASLSVLTVLGSAQNGTGLLLALGHLRRTLVRTVLQVLAILMVSSVSSTLLGWLLASVLTLDAIGDWHDRRVMRSLL